jgi:O-antigen/teichoic acid export membrane protein/peptidoglycan/xylan/chitin deacetylase (PgdA/CDA1 family)
VGRADALALTIQRTGLGAALTRMPMWRGVLVLNYHRIGTFDGGVHDPGVWSASEEDFDAQLRYLARHAEVISGDDLPDALAAPRGRRVALTFDDGYRDNYELAYPALRAHGLPATFFVATGFIDRPHVAWWDEISWMVRSSPRGEGDDAAARAAIERYWSLPAAEAEGYLDQLAIECETRRADPRAADDEWMTWDMVREMRAGGMAFGAHTVDHPVLARCTSERQALEISGSTTRLAEELGEPVSLFAYPVGTRSSFDDTTRAHLRDAGVSHAFSFYGGHARAGAPDPLDIPRTYVGPSISPSHFRARLALPGIFARPAPPDLLEPPDHVPALELDADLEAVAGEPAEDVPDAPGTGWGPTVRRGVVWSVAAFASSKALSFISILILARLLTPNQFGVVAAVAAFIALIELGSDLGMKPAVVYEQETGVSDRIQTAFTMNLITAATLSALGVLAAPLIARFFGVAGETDLFRLGALNLLFTGLGNVHDALLLRDMSFGRRIRPQVVRDIVRTIISVALAFAGLGALGLVVGFLAGTLAWTLMQWTLTPLRPRFSLDGTIARSMLAYGAPAALLEFVSTIALRVDVFAIGHLIDSHALGIYTIAYRLPEVLLASVAYALGVVAFPALAKRRVQDPAGLESATLQLVRYQALYALPVAAGMAVLAVPIIEVMFGDKWHSAAVILVPVVASAAVLTIAYPLGDLLKATGKQGLMVVFNLIQIPAVIAACVIGASSGLLAVAWGMAAAGALFTGMLCWAVMRELHFGFSKLLWICAPALVASGGVVAGAGGVRLLWTDLSLPALIVATIAGTIGAGLALRAMSPATYRDVVRQARGMRRPGRTELAPS